MEHNRILTINDKTTLYNLYNDNIHQSFILLIRKFYKKIKCFKFKRKMKLKANSKPNVFECRCNDRIYFINNTSIYKFCKFNRIQTFFIHNRYMNIKKIDKNMQRKKINKDLIIITNELI
ncbi:hypothetical protein SLOPH_789 [Spraguea lophii 42_110]|uniref:Uncharacterized protein n=1 Tax=Spraguea lophii (strain 42_110) TaxID=1358809 RepID=S7W9B2_SPRLO|nr:hypothetical protein SLOPH_789 [Spraguea lophii 42_110]